MKKVAYVFVLAVFLPSLVLACLAIRSLRDQQFILEGQQSLLYQNIADSLAKDVQNMLAELQRDFAAQVELLRSRPGEDAESFVSSFDEQIHTNWPPAEVGFVVTTNGEIRNPLPGSRPAASAFYAANGQFLGNRETAEVYWNFGSNLQIGPQPQANASSTGANRDLLQRQNFASGKNSSIKSQQRNVIPQQVANAFVQEVAPQQPPEDQNLSKVTPSEAQFGELIHGESQGTLARFIRNKLCVLVWYRPEAQSGLVYGAQISVDHLRRELKAVIERLDDKLREDIYIAVLDEATKPVAVTRFGTKPNWSHPFVATEIGELLPRWEVAVYLVNPHKLALSARKTTVFLGILIGMLVLEIGLGSVQIFSDLKREAVLARQKTDFVSNVSHELKTPLTSIRMFAEMLSEGRVKDSEKQRSYLNIITAETARLTRLINNVLDFSRMERNEKKYNFKTCDLVEIAREIAHTYRPHLESNGFTLEFAASELPLQVSGDRDALAQVVVNLLSNAEKYSESGKEISIEVATLDRWAEVRVLDRGPGVPRGCEEKIFEQFFRAHDSLSSGIQGSGLGLTLARQIARAHGGELEYRPRPGGGSCFVLRVPPLSNQHS